jgi:hypothetical protein
MNVPRTALVKLREATVTANGLRTAAEACVPAQSALRARLITAATTIDVLAELLRAAMNNRSTTP